MQLFTGRQMPGRRWSDGLHQAVEAKEGVEIRGETQTLATITIQNYFRMYDKLAGMTGTAETEENEFFEIYGLEVVVIPTHKEMVRDDMADLVYLTREEKFEAIIDDINDCRERGQPVLVGTTSIETSEFLSGELRRRDIEHQVLNAKQHAREALWTLAAEKAEGLLHAILQKEIVGRAHQIVVIQSRTSTEHTEESLVLGEEAVVEVHIQHQGAVDVVVL